MGKISQGILGGFSGAVGNVVGASWRGIDYIRVKPDHIANPRTPAQVAQRNKFKSVVGLAKSLMPIVIREYWNPLTSKMSGFNLFTKTNLPAIGDDGVIDYSKITVVSGSHPSGEITATVAEDGITINWDATNLDTKLTTDLAKAIVIREGKTPVSFNIAEQRALGESKIPVKLAKDEKAHIYLFFYPKDEKSYSNSEYASVVGA